MRTLIFLVIMSVCLTVSAQPCATATSGAADADLTKRFRTLLDTNPDAQTRTTLSKALKSQLSLWWQSDSELGADMLYCKDGFVLRIAPSLFNDLPPNMIYLLQTNMASRVRSLEVANVRVAYDKLEKNQPLSMAEARAFLEHLLDASWAEVQQSMRLFPDSAPIPLHAQYGMWGRYTYALAVTQAQQRRSAFKGYEQYLQPWTVWWADAQATDKDRQMMQFVFTKLASEGKNVLAPGSVFPEERQLLIDTIAALPEDDAKSVAKDISDGTMEVLFGVAPVVETNGQTVVKAGQFGVLPARTGTGYVGAIVVDPHWFMDPGVSDGDRIRTIYHEAVRHYRWWKEGKVPTSMFFIGWDHEWTLEEAKIRFDDEYQAYKGECELARELNLVGTDQIVCDLAGNDFPAKKLAEHLGRYDAVIAKYLPQILEYAADRH